MHHYTPTHTPRTITETLSVTARNIIHLNVTTGRKETWTFPGGTTVTLEVPADEPPITVERAVYVFSSVLHGLHRAMFGS